MANGGQKRVLLVDDRGDLHKSFGRWLEHWGYEVTHAKSAKEAIEILKNERFHAVVTDMEMEYKTAGLLVLQATATIGYFMVRILCCSGADTFIGQAKSAAGNKEVIAVNKPPKTMVELRAALEKAPQ